MTFRWKTIPGGMLAMFVVALLLVASGILMPRPLFMPERAVAGGETQRILVLSNAIHTDLAIRLDATTRSDYAFLEASGIPVGDPAAEWLVIGWGGRAFYLETPTWADLKPVPVLRALTIDSSAMHVDVAGAIDETHPAVRRVDLSIDEFRHLSDFIRGSFVWRDGGVVVIPGAGHGAYDQFFEAHGWFNALLGCNTWTAAALRAAGQRTGWWTPLPPFLLWSLDLHR
jgi:uncharacterized protein (TIGR02117 family)